jgi:hypothetical protein
MPVVLEIDSITVSSPSSRLAAIPATGDLLLIELGRQLESSSKISNQLDLDDYALCKSGRSVTPEGKAEEKNSEGARTRLFHQDMALRNLVPYIPATTLAAAAVQLGVARTLVWELEGRDLSDDQAMDVATRLKLILESALAVIVPMADMPFDFDGSY